MEILLQRFYFIRITILLPQAFFTSEKPSVYAGFLGYVSRGKEIYSNSRANPLSSSFVSFFCPKLHGEGGGTPHKSSVYAGSGSSERQNEDPALTRKVLVSYVVGAKLICPF